MSAVHDSAQLWACSLEFRLLFDNDSVRCVDGVSVGDHHLGVVPGACFDIRGIGMDFSFITDGFNAIIQFFGTVVTWFGTLFQHVFTSLWGVFLDGVMFIIDVLASILTGAMSGIAAIIPTGTLTTWAGYWSGVDSGMLGILKTIGIVPAFAIISAAILVRLVLQAIPFVRFGS
jgi:hypothetical protein